MIVLALSCLCPLSFTTVISAVDVQFISPAYAKPYIPSAQATPTLQTNYLSCYLRMCMINPSSCKNISNRDVLLFYTFCQKSINFSSSYSFSAREIHLKSTNKPSINPVLFEIQSAHLTTKLQNFELM